MALHGNAADIEFLNRGQQLKCHADKKHLTGQRCCWLRSLKRGELSFRDEFELQDCCQHVHGIAYALTNMENFKLNQEA